MLSHCHCERKSERDSMRVLWLQSARWLGFPGGTDNYNFDIPCWSGGRLKMFASGRFGRSYATVTLRRLSFCVGIVLVGRALTLRCVLHLTVVALTSERRNTQSVFPVSSCCGSFKTSSLQPVSRYCDDVGTNVMLAVCRYRF